MTTPRCAALTWCSLLALALLGCTSDDVIPEPQPEVVVVDLGMVAPGEQRVVTIPERALGFHIVVQLDAPSDGEIAGVERIVSPSGEVLVEGHAPIGHPFEVGASSYGIGAISVPQTSLSAASPVEAGEWTVMFSSLASRAGRATLYVRTSEDGEYHGGVVDLHVYLPAGLHLADPVAAHLVTAATAMSDAAVAARIDSFYAGLESLFGLGRGEVRFFDIPAEFATITTDATRLRALSETVAPPTGMALHVIWVDELAPFGSKSWGLAPWIPGSAAGAGHAMSAVVVDVTYFPAVADGLTMVHEFGHFFGLFHTSEGDGLHHDPLVDTVECTVPQSVDCPDGHNIMFWAYYGASRGRDIVVSPHQQAIVAGSPIYRATRAADASVKARVAEGRYQLPWDSFSLAGGPSACEAPDHTIGDRKQRE